MFRRHHPFGLTYARAAQTVVAYMKPIKPVVSDPLGAKFKHILRSLPIHEQLLSENGL